MELNGKNGEIVTPQDVIEVPIPARPIPWRSIFVMFSSPLVAFASNTLSHYLQTRGFVSVELAWIFLALTGLALSVLAVIGVRAFGLRRPVLTTVVVVGFFWLTLGGMEYWAIKANQQPFDAAPESKSKAIPDDPLSRIENQLRASVPEQEYRLLVAAILHNLDPMATVSVGTLMSTTDGSRVVDVQVASMKNGRPFVTAIDIVSPSNTRKTGIALVDAAESKRKDIGVDAILLCSPNGFEPSAIAKAKRTQVGLISVLRQGDSRASAVIEEEAYIRKITVRDVETTYLPNNIDPRRLEAYPLMYRGGSVDEWLMQRARDTLVIKPTLGRRVSMRYRLKPGVLFDLGPYKLPFAELGIKLNQDVQWFSQIVQIEAKAGVYDYVNRRILLADLPKNSWMVKRLDIAEGTPMPSPPPVKDLGFGLVPRQADFSFANVIGFPRIEIMPAPLEQAILPEDLILQLSGTKAYGN